MWLLSTARPNRVGRGAGADVRVAHPALASSAFLVAHDVGGGWIARPEEAAALVVRRGHACARTRADGSVRLQHGDVIVIDDLPIAFFDLRDADEQDEDWALASLPSRPPPPPAAPAPRRPLVCIDAAATRVTLHAADAVVAVYASPQRLDVVLPDGERWELGASLAGVDAAIDVARGALTDFDVPAREVGDALYDALRRAAHAVHAALAADVEADVRAMRRTPIVFARPLLQHRWLRDDLARFRAARVAAAFCEDDLPRDATPEAADAVVERLARWRDLYAPTGKATRVVNRTLQRFGDDAAARSLWGLRRLPLARVPPSVAHVDVLGALGAHPDGASSPVLREIVERAAEAELGEALVVLAEGEVRLRDGDTPAEMLVELLTALAVDARTSFPQLFADALYAWHRHLPLQTETALPPVPLPADARLVFLPDLAAVFDEGARMDNCVAMRGPSAVAGRAYLFHADDGRGRATIQVDAEGRVVEAKGPRNTANETARWARIELERWGRTFWAVRAGAPRASTWIGGPAPGAGRAPLRDVQACVDAYRRMTDELPDHGPLSAWFLQHVRVATAGATFLVEDRARGVVEALDVHGDVVGSTRDVGFFLPED